MNPNHPAAVLNHGFKSIAISNGFISFLIYYYYYLLFYYIILYFSEYRPDKKCVSVYGTQIYNDTQGMEFHLKYHE